MENNEPDIASSDKENDMQVDKSECSAGKASNSSAFGVRGKYEGVEPYKGMVFDSLDEAHQFYNMYAKIRGFGVRIRNTTNFPRSEEIRYRRFVCSCEGQCPRKQDEVQMKREKRTLTIRKGCLASFVVSRKKPNDQWISTSVINEHNHVLASPRSAGNLRNQKVMPTITKNLVEKFSEAGLPTGRVPDILNDGSVMNFSSRDCWNHMRNLRTLNLDFGDAESVFQYCKRQQAQDPNFYYSILPDKESRMVNFFWVDSRTRLYYERFGDVAVFDTTYRTSKYSMLFALFVGVNNHAQSILLGCALLQDETEESFEWLFTTWLDAINEKAPISILTDQDAAIGNAIKTVLPKTTHRLCLWHIMKKFPEKYGNLYKKKSPFKKDMKRCLHETITTQEFEQEWNNIMSRYNLQGEAWLQQRCESMHAFFDSFVHSGTTLREFVVKYEQALLRRYKDENREHYALWSSPPFIFFPVSSSLEKNEDEGVIERRKRNEILKSDSSIDFLMSGSDKLLRWGI